MRPLADILRDVLVALGKPVDNSSAIALSTLLAKCEAELGRTSGSTISFIGRVKWCAQQMDVVLEKPPPLVGAEPATPVGAAAAPACATAKAKSKRKPGAQR